MGTLIALGQILLGSIPTFFLVWILYLYVTRVFYRPLQKTLRQRDESTVGLRKTAEADLAMAEQKTAEYQEALRSARSQIYQIQERERQDALDQRAKIVQQAKQEADAAMIRAKNEIREDVENAKKGLAAEVEQIAAAISETILKPSTHTRSASLGRSEAAV